MRIYLIIVEESFFHPQFVEEIIKARKKDIFGITIVPDISPKKSKLNYIIQQWGFFGPWPFFYLGIKTVIYKLLNILSRFIPMQRFYSVQSIANHYKIPLFKAVRVNSEEHLNYLRALDIDVVVSAQGQIFKKELLELPKLACINRHSALLPKYGGLWPVFWTMLNNEKKIGVTAHTMEEKIDGGKILAQKEIPIQKNDSLYSLYKKAFKVSGEVVLKALANIEQKHPKLISYNPEDSSYFSLPSKEDADLFRQKGLRFI